MRLHFLWRLGGPRKRGFQSATGATIQESDPIDHPAIAAESPRTGGLAISAAGSHRDARASTIGCRRQKLDVEPTGAPSSMVFLSIAL